MALKGTRVSDELGVLTDLVLRLGGQGGLADGADGIAASLEQCSRAEELATNDGTVPPGPPCSACPPAALLIGLTTTS